MHFIANSHDRLPAHIEALGQWRDLLASQQGGIPLRREGTVDDVASAARQMIQNVFITGEYLTIDGGMSMRMTG